MKVLGKTSSKLLLALSTENKSIFTISDAQKILMTSLPATRNLLKDLVKKKWLIRVRPGKYLIVPLSAGEKAEFSENWYVIAKYLIEPSPYYISHYSALDIHEMTTHPVMTIYIKTSMRKRKKEIKVFGGSYRFIHTKPSKIWGIEEVWIKPTEKVKVSDLERTIIDCLSNPKFCGGISELAKGIWAKRGEIDFEKLFSYVERFNSKAVAKRLAFLLDLFDLGPKEMRKKLKKMTTASFVLLDPSLPDKGHYRSQWGLKINLDPEELKEIIKT